ncbi:MAG: ATP-binding cassette domain-containing protein [Pseudomonadota bacterium]
MMHIAAQPLLSPDGSILMQLPELTMHAGECWLVLGPNGAGKSTFLRHAAGQSGMPAATAGWNWQGQPLPTWHDTAWAQQRAYLPQQHSLRAALSVEAIVRMGAFPWQGVHAGLASALASIVQTWDLTHLLQRPWTTLSGGEQQRVQLARTALQIRLADGVESRLWLLDEPLAALDLRHQAVALEVMRAEVESGALVLTSIHDMNAALAIATHVLVLAEGEVLLHGAVAAEPLREALCRAFGVRLGWATLEGADVSGQWLVPLP